MTITYDALPNSIYLDFQSYRTDAAPLSGGTPVANFSFNVGLVLDRANDPTPLLNADWGSRQQQLQALSDNGTLWSTYGADPTKYDQVLSDLGSMGIQTVDQVDPTNGYVSSADSRTIWVHVDQTNFTTLFGPTATLLTTTTTPSDDTAIYWNGNLSLPDSFVGTNGVKGLLFDTSDLSTIVANDPGSGTAVTLPQGPQSPGNDSSQQADLYPNQIADLYKFPLGNTVPTGTIGLIEPGIGTALPSGATETFEQRLDNYLRGAGIDTPSNVIGVAPGGQAYIGDDALERSLDVGVVAAVDPLSPIALYAGSGQDAGAKSDTMTAYQQAFWDDVNDPQVISSSWTPNGGTPAPGSPFLWADQQLFVDAALRNITSLTISGDWGTGTFIANGQTNVLTSESSPYDLIVGGTSLSQTASATTDDTLTTLMAQAMAGDPATIWQLVAGGLDTLPSAASPDDWMIETVWNQYDLDGTKFKTGDGYFTQNTTTGGVDPTQPVPSYQQDYGLTPTTSDPDALVGRGLPDVSANAGGNTLYTVPSPNMAGIFDDFGTSASTPLWATLVSQIDAVFQDQGLPTLGYMNDLLYTAAVIAPASFNDVTIGNNTSSYLLGGPIDSSDTGITPTGFGYSAGPGYDLTTGLGTPNGTILTRTLTEIAHQQVSFSTVPDVLTSDGSGGWQSGADQSLLFQTSSPSSVAVSLSTGSDTTGYASDASGAFAWTSQFAEQTLQPDFDPSLVTMFDGQSQGTVVQQAVAAGDAVSVGLDATAADTPQATLSTPFGFADFTADDGSVRVAQSVAVAETAGGRNDQDAVIRLRQNGFANLSVEFYRVDDYEGTVAGLAPGSAGYAAAADARAYQLEGGGTSLSGPGYGQYGQAEIAGVNGGDLVAMKLTNNSTNTTYWAFAQANPDNGAAHMWNYGSNVWGWEDMYGGGDRDYNDLVVQIDFTSAAGHGYLA
jgi:hypothetical protein